MKQVRATNDRPTVRQKLIAAAHRVMARDGVETSSIPAIIDEAGVGRGSFYNHFRSKEELARAVFLEQTMELRAELDAISRSTRDVPRSISYAIRRCLETAGRDPLWGWFIVRVDDILKDFDRLMYESARIGLTRGHELGSVDVEDMHATILLFSSAITALMRAMLSGELSEARTYAASERLLRIAGVEPRLAREITREPMDELRRKLQLIA